MREGRAAHLAGGFQPATGVFAEDVQHREAAFAGRAEEALVDQRGESVEIAAADCLGGFEVEAAGEDAELPKERLLVVVKECMTPVDCGPQRALSLRGVGRAATEHVEAAAQPLEDLRRREHLDAGGGELERERQAVESACDLEHGVVRLKPRLAQAGPLHEQLGRVGRRQCTDWVLLLDRQVEPCPAGCEHPHVGTRCE